MKARSRRIRDAFGPNDLRIGAALVLVIAILSVIAGSAAAGASDPATRSWHYELLPASYLIDDCPPCGRPTIMEPLRGTFDLRLLDLGTRRSPRRSGRPVCLAH